MGATGHTNLETGSILHDNSNNKGGGGFEVHEGSNSTLSQNKYLHFIGILYISIKWIPVVCSRFHRDAIYT